MEKQANMQLRNFWKWEFSSDQSQTFIFGVTVNKSRWSFRNLQLSQDISLITSLYITFCLRCKRYCKVSPKPFTHQPSLLQPSHLPRFPQWKGKKWKFNLKSNSEKDRNNFDFFKCWTKTREILEISTFKMCFTIWFAHIYFKNNKNF